MTVLVEITEEMIKLAKNYAVEKQPTSYKRWNEQNKEEQYRHLFIGKLGELVGQKALEELRIPHSCPDILTVINDFYYRDLADCILFPSTAQLKADFKTAWQDSHAKIFIPNDQYFNQKKDVYIGVKIYCLNKSPFPAFPNFKKIGEVYGWVKRGQLIETEEYPSHWAYFNDMNPLEELFILEGERLEQLRLIEELQGEMQGLSETLIPYILKSLEEVF